MTASDWEELRDDMAYSKIDFNSTKEFPGSLICAYLSPKTFYITYGDCKFKVSKKYFDNLIQDAAGGVDETQLRDVFYDLRSQLTRCKDKKVCKAMDGEGVFNSVDCDEFITAKK